MFAYVVQKYLSSNKIVLSKIVHFLKIATFFIGTRIGGDLVVRNISNIWVGKRKKAFKTSLLFNIVFEPGIEYFLTFYLKRANGVLPSCRRPPISLNLSGKDKEEKAFVSFCIFQKKESKFWVSHNIKLAFFNRWLP